jgi:hypothetical protein
MTQGIKATNRRDQRILFPPSNHEDSDMGEGEGDGEDILNPASNGEDSGMGEGEEEGEKLKYSVHSYRADDTSREGEGDGEGTW